MSETKLVKRAKVILKGARTYTLAGKQFIKDVPVIVKGSEVEEFRHNGYFKFIELESKEVKVKAKKKAVVSKSSSSSEKKVGKKKAKKKASSKKKTK